jgi:uncharacterized membrane protein YgcG
MRARWALGLTTAIALVVFGSGAAAWATPPVDLGSAYVLDDVDALTSAEEAQAETRLEQLKSDTGLDLWVVYVDEFTDPSSSEEWANTTTETNGLGPTQYLLAVATESRQFYVSADSAGPLTEDQIIAIEQSIQPQLAADEWLGAVDAAAAGFEDAAGGGSGAGPSGAAGGFPFGIVIFLVIAALVILGILLVVRSRRRKVGAPAGPGAPVEQIDLAELQRRAASALVQTDDAVKTSD